MLSALPLDTQASAPAMPIFLAAGKNAAECRRIVEGRGEFHVYEFQGADGVSPFADHTPEIKHTVIGLNDPAGDDKWGDSELTALLYHAAAIKELIKANANVLVICRGGNNRSRTLAGIAAAGSAQRPSTPRAARSTRCSLDSRSRASARKRSRMRRLWQHRLT